jgi:hypothetical protein
MDYILRYELTPEDIEFLNMTTMEYEIHNPFVDIEHDSGWCDMATDARIVNSNDRVIFKAPSEQQITFLQMKFGSRLKELHSGLREIYNVAEQHNTSELIVIDSESII